MTINLSSQPILVDNPALLNDIINVFCSERLNVGRIYAGFDCEWPVNFHKGQAAGKVAVLQIALNAHEIYVIHLSAITKQINDFPKALNYLLNHENMYLVGKQIRGDLQKLRSDYGLKLTCDHENRLVDIAQMAEERGLISSSSVGLKALCKELLHVDLPKSEDIRLSQWDQQPLSSEQIEYAALDALAALKVYKKIVELRSTNILPCEINSERIVKRVEESVVTLIVGDTGCGKSTIVPSLLLDHLKTLKKGKILCLQPRRIACISIAHRVASMRGTTVGGGEVGYEISQQSVLSPNTKIVFSTAGLALQHLYKTPKATLERYKAVIIDEVHEQSVENEMVFGLLVHILSNSSRLEARRLPRIVLMTATLNVERYRQYFQRFFPQNTERANAFGCDRMFDYLAMDTLAGGSIPWQVSVKYLEDMEKSGILTSESNDFKKCKDHFKQVTAQSHINSIVSSLHKLAHSLILHHCDQKLNKEPFSILVFLPDYRSIERQWSLLEPVVEVNRHIRVHILHGQFEGETSLEDIHAAHQKEYDEPWVDVFLATSVAESSLTVPNLQVVIDFCLDKQVVWDWGESNYDLETLPTMRCIQSIQFCSKTQLTQRKGRTGRMCDGKVYRLIPVALFHKLPNYPKSHLKQSLLLDQTLSIISNEASLDIFDKCLDAPERKTVEKALKVLETIGSIEESETLTKHSNKFSMTDRGTLISSLPVSAYAAMTVLQAAEVGMLREGAILASIFHSAFVIRQSPVFSQQLIDQIYNYYGQTKSRWAVKEMVGRLPTSNRQIFQQISQLLAFSFWMVYLQKVCQSFTEEYSKTDHSDTFFAEDLLKNYEFKAGDQFDQDLSIDDIEYKLMAQGVGFKSFVREPSFYRRFFLSRQNLWSVLQLSDEIITRLLLNPSMSMIRSSLVPQIPIKRILNQPIDPLQMYPPGKLSSLILLAYEHSQRFKNVSAHSAEGLAILGGEGRVEKASSSPVCVFFYSAKGCRNGSGCSFSHSSPDAAQSIPICRDWSTNGFCKFGSECFYRHPDESKTSDILKPLLDSLSTNLSPIALFLKQPIYHQPMTKEDQIYYDRNRDYFSLESAELIDSTLAMGDFLVVGDLDFGFSLSLIESHGFEAYDVRGDSDLPRSLFVASHFNSAYSLPLYAQENYAKLIENDIDVIFNIQFSQGNISHRFPTKFNAIFWNFPEWLFSSSFPDSVFLDDSNKIQFFLHQFFSSIQHLLYDRGSFALLTATKSQMQRYKVVSIARQHFFHVISYCIPFNPIHYQHLTLPRYSFIPEEYVTFGFKFVPFNNEIFEQ